MSARVTSDRDLLDLAGLLVDPLLPPDPLSGAHQLFQFLDLLPAREWEATESLWEAGMQRPPAPWPRPQSLNGDSLPVPVRRCAGQLLHVTPGNPICPPGEAGGPR